MADVTEDRDQDGAELSAADEQLPGGPKTRLSRPDQPTPPKGHPAWAVGGVPSASRAPGNSLLSFSNQPCETPRFPS
jgi:hypothetical protein